MDGARTHGTDVRTGVARARDRDEWPRIDRHTTNTRGLAKCGRVTPEQAPLEGCAVVGWQFTVLECEGPYYDSVPVLCSILCLEVCCGS